MSQARQVYRALLKAIDRNITPATGDKRWREFAVAEFRKAVQERDPAVREQSLQHAKDYAFLLDSVREHRVSRGWGGGPPGKTSCRCRHSLAALETHAHTLPLATCRSCCSPTTLASQWTRGKRT